MPFFLLITVSIFKVKSFNFAIVNVGAPACGVNSAVRAFVRSAVGRGCKVFAVYGGFDGLGKGKVIFIQN